MLKRVEDTPKGPRLILSRSDAMFVTALFKLEVPEIQQGIVEIKAAAREVGSRTKIAVMSRDAAVDPVVVRLVGVLQKNGFAAGQQPVVKHGKALVMVQFGVFPDQGDGGMLGHLAVWCGLP